MIFGIGVEDCTSPSPNHKFFHPYCLHAFASTYLVWEKQDGPNLLNSGVLGLQPLGDYSLQAESVLLVISENSLNFI